MPEKFFSGRVVDLKVLVDMEIEPQFTFMTIKYSKKENKVVQFTTKAIDEILNVLDRPRGSFTEVKEGIQFTITWTSSNDLDIRLDDHWIQLNAYSAYDLKQMIQRALGIKTAEAPPLAESASSWGKSSDLPVSRCCIGCSVFCSVLVIILIILSVFNVISLFV